MKNSKMNVEQLHQLTIAYEELISYIDSDTDIDILEAAMELGLRLRRAIIAAQYPAE